jgi:diketogulonate reductase-like aldo/keto reductase
MRTVRLPDGTLVPVLGQGTWPMGANTALRANEIAALRLGIDLGMTLIDTAEDYSAGEAEKVVAAAISGQRERAFIVTKVHPFNASFPLKMPAACEGSLKRLRTDCIDLYLLHWWRGQLPELRCHVPLSEIVGGFEMLKQAGKIKRWGVSNFARDEMIMLQTCPGGVRCTTNQVPYSLNARGIERDLLPTANYPIMAYSPIRVVPKSAVINAIATRHGVSPAQIALAWVIRHQNVIAIPKSGNVAYTRENAAAADIQLTQQDYGELEVEFRL